MLLFYLDRYNLYQYNSVFIAFLLTSKRAHKSYPIEILYIFLFFVQKNREKYRKIYKFFYTREMAPLGAFPLPFGAGW